MVITKYLRSAILPFALSTLGSLIICFYFFDFPFSLKNNFIWETDGLLVQSQIQSIIDSGIFGKTDHLGFPFGFSQWNNPEISYFHALLIWISSKIFQISTYGYLILIVFTTIILNSILIYYLSTLLTKNRILNFLFLTFGLMIPYPLYSLDHPHVITFYIYVAIIIMILKIDKLNSKLYVLFVLVLFATNMFQLILVSFIFTILVIPYFLYFMFSKENRFQIISLFKIYTIVISVFGLNFINFIYYSNINGDNGRAAYHSDLFAGKLTDILLSSPIVNRFIPNLEILKTGGTEARFIGLPLLICFLSVFVLLILYPLLKIGRFSLKILFSLLFISLFTFITGGFGNLQASFFVMLGHISPMRSWSRLSIFIGLLSFVLIFYMLQQKLNDSHLLIIMSVVIFLSALDLTQLERDSKFRSNIDQLEETEFIQFVDKTLDPCPILQLPIDTYFIPQSAWDKGWRYYWNGMIPYVALPEFKWTSATYVDSPGWEVLQKIPSSVGKGYIDSVKNDYCAIVFDKNFSQYQIDRQASLSSTPGSWPGLRVENEIKPDFEDTRYSVYLIND